MSISAITALAVANAGGKGQGGSRAGVCTGDTNGAGGGDTGATLIGFSSFTHSRSPQEGWLPFPLSAESPQGRAKSWGKGHPGHGPYMATLTGTCRITPVCPPQPCKCTQMGTHVHTHTCAGTHAQGAKGTGRGWGTTGAAQGGTPTLGGLWEGVPGWVLGKGHK